MKSINNLLLVRYYLLKLYSLSLNKDSFIAKNNVFRSLFEDINSAGLSKRNERSKSRRINNLIYPPSSFPKNIILLSRRNEGLLIVLTNIKSY